MEDCLVEKLKEYAAEIRRDVIQMTYNVGGIGAHIGGSLSLCEIMAVLYRSVLKFDLANRGREDRDRVIISKGHGVMAQYAAFKQIGLITEAELYDFKKPGSWLTAHPIMDVEHLIDFSTGSLGHGLGLGVGMAWALKMKGNDKARVYVIVGDGECDEGSVWESAAAACQLGLDNLIVIVDKNQLQFDDRTENIIAMNNMADRWKAFGWQCSEVNGHDVSELRQALLVRPEGGGPYCVVANTLKGKGVSFVEGVAKWHLGRLSKDQYEQAMKEQEAAHD